jgi:signal transduction histidine kinase
MKISTKLTLLMALIFCGVIAGMFLALAQIRGMEYDGHVVNLAGEVRGTTQRLVKLEMAGQPTDDIASRVDLLLHGLIYGDRQLRLPPAEDPAFRKAMLKVQSAWKGLKEEIREARQQPELRPELLEKSEGFFSLADHAVLTADAVLSGKIVRHQIGMVLLTTVNAVLIVLVWVVVHRKFARPIERLSQGVGRIAAGDLSVELPAEGRDEISRLASGTNAMVGTLRDMIERLSEAKERAEAANRVKGEFLSRMSHELRTPLNAILGYTELVLDEVDGPVRPEQRKDLEKVDAQAKRLLEMIDRILDFARLGGAEALEVAAAEFRLDEFLGFLEAHAARANDKGLTFQTRVEPGVPDVLVGSPRRLQEVLDCLVDNAVKFTVQGGVEVRVGGETGEGGEAGIPEAQRAAVFEAFFQLERTSTREHEGIGLGLAAAALLAQSVGGRLWAESELGRGSTFHFAVACRTAHLVPA